jgi:uncharacterized membrane protein YfcA
MGEWWLFVLPVAAGALVQGLTGFGIGLTAIGLVSLLTDDMENGTAVLTSVTLVILAVSWWRTRRDNPVRWGDIWRLFNGCVIGLPVGYAFIVFFGDQPIFRLVLGIVLISFAVLGWRGTRLGKAIHRCWAVPLGCLSGFISGAFVSGGPPLVLYLYSREPTDPRRMVSTVQALFFMYTAVRLGIVAARGKLAEPQVLIAVAWAIPLGVGCLMIGYALARRMQPRLFAMLAYGLVALMGCLTLWQAVMAFVSESGSLSY